MDATLKMDSSWAGGEEGRRVKGLGRELIGRELIESFKEEKEEDDDKVEDSTNTSKCVASGNGRTREDTGRKDEQEDEALRRLLLLLLHWIELVESRTSRGSPAEGKEHDDDNDDTLWYGGRWWATRWRFAAAANLLLLFSTAPTAVAVMLLPPFFVPTQLKFFFLINFFSGEYPKRFDLETFKKICTIWPIVLWVSYSPKFVNGVLPCAWASYAQQVT